MGIWVYPYTVMPVQVRRGVLENWGGAEPEWCCNVMVKAPNPLGVHPTSMSYVYKVFQHLDTLWMGIWLHPYTVPILLGSYFVVLCHLWSQHDVIMSRLRLTATSNWFPHP
jgi:hypothetical protein